MCLGDSGAVGAADAAEAKRQQQIAATTARIRGLFDDPAREQEYAAHRDNVLEYNMDAHEEGATDAARNLKFALARKGLSGGSAHVDAKTRLDGNIADQALSIGRFADQSANNLRSADERSKQTLITQAQTGLDANTAGDQALSNMQFNLDQASADTTYGGIGDLMSNIALLNQQNAQAQGRSRVQSPLSPGASSSKRYAGTTTSLG